MIRIKKVERHEDYERCVDLQKIVWGFADRDVVPSRTFIIAQHHGGSVIGAFNDEGELIGFAMAVASVHYRMPGQHSCMLAVLPSYQNQGIGWRLKMAQREAALELGASVITWTFDPLEARNAHLNLNKLGAIARTYYPNRYGQSSSEYHSGLGTDRLLAEWWIGSRRARDVLAGHRPPPAAMESAEKINAVYETGAGLPASGEPRLEMESAHLLVEIPPDIQLLKRLDLELARDWRTKSRRALKHYLDRNYAATALIVEPDPRAFGGRRSAYLLERFNRELIL